MSLARADRDVVGLTVLALLLLGPKHTYEMHRMMIDTRKDFVTGLPRSMYHAVERLEKAELIVPQETIRDGARPERTVYAITDSGRVEVRDRVQRLLEHPDPDSTLFVAALSFLACVSPAEAAEALRVRINVLSGRIAALQIDVQNVPAGLPRVLVVESEFELARLRSERSWAQALLDDIEQGELTWPADVSQLADIDATNEEAGPGRSQ